MSLRSIRKRDGSEAPYEKERIAAAVASAQAAVGEDDPTFAGEVAELVDFALRRRYAMDGAAPGEGGTPDLEEVQDLVEMALIQLGRAAVAKAYILYRDRRTRVREARHAGREAPADPAVLRTLKVREAERTSPWSKGRIIAALVDEAGLGRSLAEEVAQRVERRVVSSGLRRITTALVRELVAGELLAMNLGAALARHEPVALPRHDLRQLIEFGPREDGVGGGGARWLAGTRLGEDSLEGVVGGEILRRFALSDLFDERASEAVAAGELQLEDLRRPHLHLVQAVPCELVTRGAPGVRAAFELAPELAGLTASVSRGVVLEAPGALLQPLARGSRGDAAAGIAGWLLTLASVARASGRRIDLSRLGARSPALIARLLEELDELAGAAPADDGVAALPRLFLDREELHATLAHFAARGGDEAAAGRAALDRLMAAGLAVPTWSREDELFAGPGCRRRGREQGALACGGAAAINLVRAARRAGPWREDLALEEIARQVEGAIDALAQLAHFQRRARSARAGEARGRIAYAIAPVGLREALRVLGDGEVRADQGARLVGLVSDAARRLSARRGLSVVLSSFFARRAAARFALLDASEPRVSQQLLFGELARGAVERGAAWSAGFDLGPISERSAAGAPGEAEAELCSTVPTGAWTAPGAGGFAIPEPGAALEAWLRFDRLREERRTGALAEPAQASALQRADETGALFPVESVERGG